MWAALSGGQLGVEEALDDPLADLGRRARVLVALGPG
jgi:hypothetical protein